MTQYRSIKNLSKDDRPREKLVESGRGALSNAEILGILIGSGTREKSAVKLCQEILESVDNDLNRLARLSIHDLTKFKGIGQAKAVTIAAALELGRRKQSEAGKSKDRIGSSQDVYNVMIQRFQDLDHEEFYILNLSRSNEIKSIELISKGGISGTVVDGKLIFKSALAQTSAAIILCHNHPSGNLKPSQADIDLTKKIKEFGKMIDLPVLDHLIITDKGYYSFADEGIF
ncbi:RadC family protein [Crocinitomix catalasitica]|uniref:RadC family protein n=1 Tax=Crocinitomix catalasitica TaxID=184607 RepID=UPI0004868FA4|nr:DNA repair protein RadC [Crocinitomix catalasitica]